MSSGDTLLVLARNEDGSWLEVETRDGKRAWVFAELVKMSVQPDSIPLALKIPPTPERIIPRTGHWQGRDPSVAFDIAADGNIHNFEMVAPFGLPTSTCTVRAKEIVVERDGTFTFTVPLLEAFENRISGKFETATTLTGTYLLAFCIGEGGSVSIIITLEGQDPVKNWQAEWKGP